LRRMQGEEKCEAEPGREEEEQQQSDEWEDGVEWRLSWRSTGYWPLCTQNAYNGTSLLPHSSCDELPRCLPADQVVVRDALGGEVIHLVDIDLEYTVEEVEEQLLRDVRGERGVAAWVHGGPLPCTRWRPRLNLLHNHNAV
jgi:hypothetical protein